MIDEYAQKRRDLAERMAARLSSPAWMAKVAELEAEAAQDSLNQRRWRRKYLGIPRAFEAALDAPKETEVLARVQAFIASPKLVLLLAGAVGRGKSIAAAWAVEDQVGRYMEAADIVQANLYDAQAWRAFFTPGLLAVDELGMEPLDLGGWGAAKLYDLLNGRMQAAKKTILVTNLDGRAFFARYPDKRLKDRFRAHGAFFQAEGESMRGASRRR